MCPCSSFKENVVRNCVCVCVLIAKVGHIRLVDKRAHEWMAKRLKARCSRFRIYTRVAYLHNTHYQQQMHIHIQHDPMYMKIIYGKSLIHAKII